MENVNTEKKKRGRKPKGGKIINNVSPNIIVKPFIKQSVILHLKCSVSENKNNSYLNSYNDSHHYIKPNTDSKNITEKIEQININFKNSIINTTSSCFWDTEPFNTSPVFIPKKITDSGIEVYGHFCSPECATGFLFNENIDTSTKWERYSYINNIYNKQGTTNIKPSPNPYYILDKYYGNITIKEYRDTTKCNELVIIDKPITKITPEIHIANKTNNKM